MPPTTLPKSKPSENEFIKMARCVCSRLSLKENMLIPYFNREMRALGEGFKGIYKKKEKYGG